MPAISDLLYAMTEWLRTTPLPGFALWIADQPISQSLATSFLTIPVIQTIHILSIATAFAAVLMMNLRLLGYVGAGQTIAEAARRYQPWVVGALLLLVATGVGLIVAEPVRELINPIFWIKMGMITALLLVSLGFNMSVRRSLNLSDPGAVAASGVRAGAIALILLWCAVIIAGRWIAYAPT